MSIQSAKDYMLRMRSDPAFKQSVESRLDDESRWAFVKAQGYEFTFREFDAAQVELLAEKGSDQPGT